MYAVIRRYQFDPESSAEINRKMQEDFVRLICNAPGFVAYYWLDTGEGAGASLSIFEDKTGAEKSVHLTANYVQKHLAALLGRPTITQGEVRAHA
jgi:hypothetical protein